MSDKKASKAQQEAAAATASAQTQAGLDVNTAAQKVAQDLIAGGKTARQQMMEAGAQTPEEKQTLQRYTAQSTAPAESLMTQAGPISQAIAQRVLERSQAPGMDYNTQSAAFAEGVGKPIWRSLKERGVVAPPGAEGGGGLATQQYMQGAVPALAELRQQQINQDIATGQNYGQQALGQQNFYTQLAQALSEAIRGREYGAGLSGAEAEQAGLSQGEPYYVTGAEAKGQGAVAGAQTNQAEVQQRYAQKAANNAAIANAIMFGGMQLIPSMSSFTQAPQQTANIQGMGQVPVAPANYYRTPAAQIPSVSQSNPASTQLAARISAMGRG